MRASIELHGCVFTAVARMTASLNTGVIPPEPVGDRLGRARRYAGHEQAAFAELLGTSRRTVSRIESGVKVPTRAELVSWAFATGVDLNWLETGEAPSPDGDGASVVRHQGLEPRTRWLGASAGQNAAVIEFRRAA